jgi:hypothetical protein
VNAAFPSVILISANVNDRNAKLQYRLDSGTWKNCGMAPCGFVHGDPSDDEDSPNTLSFLRAGFISNLPTPTSRSASLFIIPAPSRATQKRPPSISSSTCSSWRPRSSSVRRQHTRAAGVPPILKPQARSGPCRLTPPSLPAELAPTSNPGNVSTPLPRLADAHFADP